MVIIYSIWGEFDFLVVITKPIERGNKVMRKYYHFFDLTLINLILLGIFNVTFVGAESYHLTSPDQKIKLTVNINNNITYSPVSGNHT